MEVLLWSADTRCKYNILIIKFLYRINAYCSTSPSLYLQLVGTAAVHDLCTAVSPNLINPIVTLPPGGLSTWRPPANHEYDEYDNFTVGEIWQDPSPDLNVDIADGIAQLNVNDLACPTWGLGRSTAADGTVITTIGPPWLPLIVAPIEIFSLDPTWASVCTGMFNMQFYSTTVALFDPPTALMPAPLLAPTSLARPTPTPVPTPADPTTVPERATSYAEVAKPASLPNDPAAPPARTGDPGKGSPSQSPVAAPADPASPPQNSAASSKNKGDPPSESKVPLASPVAGDPSADPLSNTKVSSVSAVAGDLPADPPSKPKVPTASAVSGDPLAESNAPSSTAPDPPSNPKVPNVPVRPPGEDSQSQSQGLGAIIYNAFGRSGPDVEASSTTSLPPQTILTIGAQTFTVNPTGFKINDAAISPGGTAHTVDGTVISLGQSGILAIGSSTVSLTSPSPTTILTVAGHTFMPNPSAFSIAGSIVSAGGPAVTVDGTTISLDQLGALAVGSTTISLTDPSPTPFATKAFTVAGQAFTPNPSAFSIAGTTISADGPAVTISGTIVSLGPNGALEIGSSTISLPPISETPPNKVYTVAGQKFTPNPSAFSVAGTIVSAGGPAVTVDGTLISLDPSGALAIGSSTIDLPSLSDPSPSKVYTVGGQTFTPNPSAFPIAGTVLSAGGPAITVDGTIISLGQSGALAIGSSTIDLPSLSDPSPSKVYTVAGQTFTPNPSAFPIANTMISAGGPAATINGTIISLQPSGALIIGSSTIPLSTTSDMSIDGFGINAQSSFVVIDGVTLSAAAAGVTISGTLVSLEAGGATLDIGTGRFALPTATTGAANGSVNVQAFTGGQEKGRGLSLALMCGVCGIVVLLTV